MEPVDLSAAFCGGSVIWAFSVLFLLGVVLVAIGVRWALFRNRGVRTHF